MLLGNRKAFDEETAWNRIENRLRSWVTKSFPFQVLISYLALSSYARSCSNPTL